MSEHKESEQSLLPEYANLEVNFRVPDSTLEEYKNNVKKEFQTASHSAPQDVIEVDVVGVYLAPSPFHQFHSHWGIQFKDSLLHLVFELDERRQPVRIVFSCMKPINLTKYTQKGVLGKTRYSLEQLCAIGDMLIACFGSYHRMFWNCQHWANCFLDIICNGEFQPITTSAAVLRTAMFATIIGAPTTREYAERQVHTDVLGKTKDQLELESDAAILSTIPSKESDTKEPEVPNYWKCIVM